jgi:hypothetical protein
MTLALRPARRYLLSNRRLAAPQKDITGCVRALTRLLSAVVAGLLVWIVILGVSLPTADTTRQWRLLWIGFDTAEVAALGVTLWAVYRSRQLAIPAALITGTLFACDAWFDLVLSWGTHGWWFSLATAVLVELPLAALLWGSACGFPAGDVVYRRGRRLRGNLDGEDGEELPQDPRGRRCAGVGSFGCGDGGVTASLRQMRSGINASTFSSSASLSAANSPRVRHSPGSTGGRHNRSKAPRSARSRECTASRVRTSATASSLVPAGT